MELINRLSQSYGLRLVALAAAYVVTGWLALLLAIPPEFVSPIWPAAGIAVAGILLGGYRYMPGVFLGAFIADLIISVDSGGHIATVRTVSACLILATGATLQATLGAFLVKRFSRLPIVLENEKDISIILFMAGPFACLLNATVGTLVLMQTGVVSHDDFLNTWLIWWVGDTIGVILFLPIIIILASPGNLASRRRKFSILLPLSIVILLVAGLFFFTRYYDENAIQNDFSERAEKSGRIIQERTNSNLKLLQLIERFYGGSDFVSRSEFRKFVEGIVEDNVGIHALEWVPRVKNHQRSEFERLAIADGISDFRISQKSESGLIAARQRDEYFPVYYLESYQNNVGNLGLDYAHDPELWSAMVDARDSGLPIATRGQRLLRDQNHRASILVFHPLYESGYVTDSIESRQQHHKGFVVGTFIVNEIIEADIRSQLHRGCSRLVYDNYIQGDDAIVFGEADVDAPFATSILWEAGGRQWTIEFFPSAYFFSQKMRWNAWMVLIGGLFFATLFQIFLLVVTARAELVRKLVEVQTAEIREKNKSLGNAVEVLSETNSELERFAYVASHDLQEPLRKILAFSSILELQHSSQLDEKAKEYLGLVASSASRMRLLIDSILEYARLGNEAESYEVTDTNRTMGFVRENLKESLEKSGAELTCENLPVINTNPVRISRVFQNLVGNALKYQKDGVTPMVRVSAKELKGEWLFSVSDNGIGLDPEHCERIFIAFERLHGKKEYVGTGLGLTICQKIVEGFGGKIWAESRLGEGSVFYFTIPVHSSDAEND